MLRAIAGAVRRSRWRIVGGIAAALGVGLLILTVVLPRATNGAALTVLTGSMRPTYPPGSLLIVRPVEPASIGEGDVITYQSPGGNTLTTHRVVEIRTNESGALEFVTKGDANEGKDPRAVLASTVQGKVWFGVPYVGLVRNAISSQLGMLVGGTVLVMALGWDRITAQWARLSRRTRGGAPDDPINRTVTDGSEPVLAAVPAVAPVAGESTTADAAFGDVVQQLLLLRILAWAEERTAVLCLSREFHARVVDIDAAALVLAVAGTPDELDEVERKLGIFDVVESERTSIVAIRADACGGVPSHTRASSGSPSGIAAMANRSS